jgi:hypothetical protein
MESYKWIYSFHIIYSVLNDGQANSGINKITFGFGNKG